METTRLSSKGQIILPKSVRAAHQWKPGLDFSVETVEGGVMLRPLKTFASTSLDDVVGSAGYRGPKRTLADMERAILTRAKRSW